MVNEHIIIADELADHSIEPTTVSRRMAVNNRVRGITTELTFFDEGCIGVRQKRKGKSVRDHLLELRHLNPKPAVSRRSFSAFLWIALVLGSFAFAAGAVLPATEYATYTLSVTIGASTLALLSLLLHIYRSDIRYRFFTATGRAVVFSVTASFGSKGKTRTLVRELNKAIVEARNKTTDSDIDSLRAEMKAHYKLAETGVISRKACSNGTALILSKFN